MVSHTFLVKKRDEATNVANAYKMACIEGTMYIKRRSAARRRQRGRVVRASDLKSVGRGFESRSDH